MDELQHHGIDGMHWGERNGPPYPLGKAVKAKVYGNHGELKSDTQRKEKGSQVSDDISSLTIDKYWKMTPIDRALSPFGDIISNTNEYKKWSQLYEEIVREGSKNKNGEVSKELEDKFDNAVDELCKKNMELSKNYFGKSGIGYHDAYDIALDRRNLETSKVKHSDEDELQHWGILGMKWGIRRYQNYDGTYTNLGKKRKRLDVEGESNPELDKRRSDLPSNNPQEKRSNLYANKPVNEMTDMELRDLLTRIDMERKYNDYINSMAPKIDPVEKEIKTLRNQLELKNLKNQLNPKPTKKQSPILEVIGPALKNAASKYINNKLEDLVKKKDESKKEDPIKKEIEDLKKKVELRDLRDKLSGGSKNDKTLKEIEKLERQVKLKDLRDKLSGKADDKDPRDSYISDLEKEWKIGNLKNKIGLLNKNDDSSKSVSASKQTKDSNSNSDPDLYSAVHTFLSGRRAARTANVSVDTNNGSQSSWQQSFDSLFTPYNSAMGSGSSGSQSIWDRPLEGFSTGGSWLDRYIDRTTRKIGM